MKRVDEVVDLVVAQREAERRALALAQHVAAMDRASGRGGTCSNSRGASSKERSTVSVMRSCSSARRCAGLVASRRSRPMPRSMRRTAREAAVARDVGRLRRPRRDRAEARHDQEDACRRRRPRRRRCRRRAARSSSLRLGGVELALESRRSSGTRRRASAGRDRSSAARRAAWRGGTPTARAAPRSWRICVH